MQVRIDGASVNARFQAVRVLYRLQVSPAPGVATFDDVPTSHPFFQFIQALVAAGITSGCSAAPPLYCPDAAITRGRWPSSSVGARAAIRPVTRPVP